MIKLSDNDNYIIAELEISDDEAKKEVKIINSYEAFKRSLDRFIQQSKRK